MLQTSMSRAVGRGVTYSRVGGVVLATTGLAVGGGVTCSGVGGVVQAKAPSSWGIPPSSSSLVLGARAGVGQGRVEALAILLVARRMLGRGPGRAGVPSLLLRDEGGGGG